MKPLNLFLVLAIVICCGPVHADRLAVTFTTVDIYLDSDEPIAAWQFELRETNGQMKVVGVENGDSDAFPRAPYFDREAVQLGTADRIIVADYSLDEGDKLPSRRFRVATIHLQLTGGEEPDFDLELIAAANTDGTKVDAAISIERPTGS